ncbi:MAG: hypothetical protein WD431_19720 [Cyclobacteriaceae bacterium]
MMTDNNRKPFRYGYPYQRRMVIYLLGLLFLVWSRDSEGSEPDHPFQEKSNLKIGWSSVDITPKHPVLLAGQFHARLSESILDPLTATALVLDASSEKMDNKVVLVSCDLICIGDDSKERSYGDLIGRVRDLAVKAIPDLLPEQIILNGTHTHTAPYFATKDVETLYGVSLELISGGEKVTTPEEYLDFAAAKIANGIQMAWENRQPGGISYGLSHAAIGQNRIQALKDGKSRMYGNTNDPDFSHIEGYEDHSVNALFTWDGNKELTGMVINVAVPSQVTGGAYFVSADFWHETRNELSERLGKGIYVLPQTAAAGDQSPRVMVGQSAERRMQELYGFGDDGGMARRKQIAYRITDAIESILPLMKKEIEWSPRLSHQSATLHLSRRLLRKRDVKDAKKESSKWSEVYQKLLDEAKSNPKITKEKRWYHDLTRSYRLMRRGDVVSERYQLEKNTPKIPVEVHVVRISDMVMATNPFELYLDYGMRIKAQSPATQTFIVQLAGSGSYLPTKRSIAGGAYGAVPASTLVGPEGGEELVSYTLQLIEDQWE